MKLPRWRSRALKKTNRGGGAVDEALAKFSKSVNYPSKPVRLRGVACPECRGMGGVRTYYVSPEYVTIECTACGLTHTNGLIDALDWWAATKTEIVSDEWGTPLLDVSRLNPGVSDSDVREALDYAYYGRTRRWPRPKHHGLSH